MCGIFGYVKKGEDQEFLHKANEIQRHRGPDGDGIFTGKEGNWNVGFAHQRLSIIDLSSYSDQPISSLATKNTLSFNGEIYNYKELISEENLSSDLGDTRVLLEMLDKYGPKSSEKLNGMWAFSYLDITKNSLILSRDRFGEKPLYYYLEKECLYFSSELKTLLKILPHKFDLDYEVIGQFLFQGLTNYSSNSILKNIKQVKPGHNYIFKLNKSYIEVDKVRFWNPNSHQIDNISFQDASQEVNRILKNSIEMRLRSDVPVGVLLSGGIDSSSIAALASLENTRPVHTLSAISDIPNYDESFFINKVNKHLKSKDNTVVISPDSKEAFRLLEKSIYYNDFPINDFSNVMHFELMKYAREIGLKVVLSGQGADESFCGYRKYLFFYLQMLIKNNNFFGAAKLIFSFLNNKSIINQFNFSEAKRYLPFSRRKSIYGEELTNFLPVNLGLQNRKSLKDRQKLDLFKTSVPALTHYEDRMSMSHGIEIRLPFLDHRLVEFALRIPDSYKIDRGWTKLVLRQAMKDYLPKEISWRKDKQGFLNPQSIWLKKDWKKEIVDLLSSDSLIYTKGLINKKNIIKRYEDFCKGKNIWHREILSVLSMEIWLRQNKDFLK